ncbi:MAG: methylated-DNA--[protein]-cysteine S-methyltransferase [Thermoplasmatales archaeon]|nr:methylated-DNA--[protein]-cysteine S-methyltransferase [Thermoplasmatales archaeon]
MPNGFGAVRIRFRGNAVTGITFGGKPSPGEPPEEIAHAVGQLRDYFDGWLTSFDVETIMPGGFAGDVMATVSRIPYGETESYSGLAAALGRPGAARAVGNACARNPVPVIVPCHRVVRSDGSVGGFAAGVGMKERLLALEKGISLR